MSTLLSLVLSVLIRFRAFLLTVLLLTIVAVAASSWNSEQGEGPSYAEVHADVFFTGAVGGGTLGGVGAGVDLFGRSFFSELIVGFSPSQRFYGLSVAAKLGARPLQLALSEKLAVAAGIGTNLTYFPQSQLVAPALYLSQEIAVYELFDIRRLALFVEEHLFFLTGPRSEEGSTMVVFQFGLGVRAYLF